MPALSSAPLYSTGQSTSIGKKPKGKMSHSKEVSAVVESVRELFPDKNLDEVVCYLKVQRRELNANNLIDAVYELDQRLLNQKRLLYTDDGSLNSEGSSCHSNSSLEPATKSESDEATSSETEEEEEISMRNKVNQTKQMLREKINSLRVTCQYCHKRQATILLLPCAHLACCQNCLMDVRRCPVSRCKKVIRGTKEVFFC